MKSIACLTFLIAVTFINGEPIHLRPIAESPSKHYYFEDVPDTSVYKPRSAYVPFPGSAPENTYYKGYESDAMEYNRWKRAVEPLELKDDLPESLMSEIEQAED